MSTTRTSFRLSSGSRGEVSDGRQANPPSFSHVNVSRPVWLGALLAAIVFAPLLVAFMGLTVARRDVRRLRRVADSELRRPSTLYLHSGLVACRSKQLTSPRHRATLARSVTRTVKHLSPNRLPGATPLNRVAVRPHADLLFLIAEKLRAQDRPVAPRGVLLVEELLTSPNSPLYAPEPPSELRQSLIACLDALDGTPGNVRTDSDRVTAVA